MNAVRSQKDITFVLDQWYVNKEDVTSRAKLNLDAVGMWAILRRAPRRWGGGPGRWPASK